MNAETPDTLERVVLASRPVGLPRDADFRIERAPLAWPQPGKVLLETLWVSIDPYQRSLLDEAGAHVPGLPLGATIAARTISRVLDTSVPGFARGDLVLAQSGWSSHAVADPLALRIVDPDLPPTTVLGVLGVAGACGYFGIEKLARPEPGETVVVAAAAGPVGSAAGQIARLRGARVVGIVSGAAKAAYVRDELGFDVALDRLRDDLSDQLAAATPDGVDVYFENVGGTVFRAVADRLNDHARMPVCGVVSTYNQIGLPTTPDWTDQFLRLILAKRLRVEGFVQTDFYDAEYAEFRAACVPWLREGRLRYRESVTDGLASAPGAMRRMLTGESIGKSLVRLGVVGTGRG
jgi:NADPH-dependent curcumin reductase CurA